MPEHRKAKRIVVIGGGAVGCATAYFLTRHALYDSSRDRVTLFEATEIAGGASGKAHASVASWAAPPCLATLSWQLHTELATEHNGADRYGFRRVRSVYCEIDLDDAPGRDPPATITPSSKTQVQTTEPVPKLVDAGRVTACNLRGNGPEGSAQLHPYWYTKILAQEAEAKGATIIFGSVTKINYSDDGKAVQSVLYTAKGSEIVNELLADYVVVAAGPWSKTVLPKIPIGGARNNTLLLEVPSTETLPELVSFNNKVPGSWFPRVKIYPRPDNTVYISAGTDAEAPPLPASSDQVEVDEEVCARIRLAAEYVSSLLHNRRLIAAQAAYRPIVTIEGRDRGVGPLLGPTVVAGLIVATGHDNWGIQNSPSTGKIVSEIIFDGAVRSADISSLAPGDVV
ncbi:FAD dependent oxidoreductase [Xylaria sp. FL1777]|nr:FAD dependent oxidoreductase [Xylaria sp. FL1777]